MDEQIIQEEILAIESMIAELEITVSCLQNTMSDINSRILELRHAGLPKENVDTYESKFFARESQRMEGIIKSIYSLHIPFLNDEKDRLIRQSNY
jgi:hypothetical protein